MGLNSFLESLEDGSALYIKSQDAYADYYAGFGWFGPLTAIDNKYMYKLNMNYEDSIQLTGTPVDVSETSIPLNQGWNWIGYTPQTQLDINTALSNLQPDHALYIKSQDAYSDYYEGFGWFGPLNIMNPFQGYLLNMVLPDDLVYSTGFSLSHIQNDNDFMWELNIHDYEFNGSATIGILLDGQKINSDNYQLAAFNGTKCVGQVKPLIFPLTGDYVFPLMMHGNENSDKITFKLYDESLDKYLEINNTLEFYNNMHLGNGFNPVIVEANDIIPDEIEVSAPYPNPFNPSVNLDVDLFKETFIKANVYNLQGQLIETIYEGFLNQGLNKLTWDANNKPSGIYFINIENSGVSIANYKISLLK